MSLLKFAVAALAVCAPQSAISSATPRSQGLRLIKTSESDAGTWMSTAQRLALIKSDSGFIDITNAKVGKTAISVQSDPKYPDSLSHVDEVNTLIKTVDMDQPKDWLEHLSSYHTRLCETKLGAEAGNWLYDTIKQIGSVNEAFTVEQIKHPDYPQKSIIARIPGESDNLVIVGAHFDSVNQEGANETAPGADDNASGSVTILEALRVLVGAGFTPKNTLEFHWYAAEELGLIGSREIWADYKAKGKSVVSYVNQDMTGYQPSGTPCVITDNTHKGLTEYVKLLVTEYTGKAPNTDACGYACSDHASVTENGFPAAFLFEDLNDKSSLNIHTEWDTPDLIQWDAVERHIKFSIGYLVEASYLDATKAHA